MTKNEQPPLTGWAACQHHRLMRESQSRGKKQKQKENKIIDFHLLLLRDRVSWVPPAGFNQTIESCMNYLLEFCTHLKHISHLVPFVRLRCIQRRSLPCTNSCLRWEKCTSKIKKKTSANVRFGNNWFRTETVKLIRVFKVQFIIHWDEIRKFESNSIFSGVKFEFIYMAGIQSVFFAFRPLALENFHRHDMTTSEWTQFLPTKFPALLLLLSRGDEHFKFPLSQLAGVCLA